MFFIVTMFSILPIACVFSGSSIVPSPPTLLTGTLPAAPECPSGTTARSSDRIAFMSDGSQEGHHEIYIMQADGSGRTQLTHSPINAHDPVWSPDGNKIFFLSEVGSEHLSNNDLFVMNADGSEQTVLVNNVWRNPVISPDGSRILFARLENEQAETAGSSEIYSMNIDGSNLTKLTNNNTANYIATWSPDGKQIVIDDNSGIYVINADGNGKQKVTAGNYPTWSPDGSRIAFNITRLPGIFEPAETPTYRHLFTIRPDGTGLIDLYDNQSEGFPQWSPNGDRIAFFSANLVRSSYSLNVINADGSGGLQLLETRGASTPVWSPDGEWIALSIYPDLGSLDADIAVTRSTCAGFWNLTNAPGDDTQPVWSPK